MAENNKYSGREVEKQYIKGKELYLIDRNVTINNGKEKLKVIPRNQDFRELNN